MIDIDRKSVVVMIHVISPVIVVGMARGTLRLARNGDVIFTAVLVAVIRLFRAIGIDAVCVVGIEIVHEAFLVLGRDLGVTLEITFASPDLARVAFRVIETDLCIVDILQLLELLERQVPCF